MKRTALISIVIVLILLGVGVVWALTKESASTDLQSPNETNTTTNTPQPNEQTSEEEAEMPPANNAVITYTDTGFTPQVITVATSSTITIKNESSKPLDFASDEHPSHTENSELNIGAVQPGSSQTVTVTTAGTWGYHNHLSANDTGRIITE